MYVCLLAFMSLVISCALFYFSNLVILVTLVCLVVATVSAASAALLSCRVRCLYHCIYHLLLANKVMMITQNNHHYAVQGHSRSPIPIESSYGLPISD